MPTIPLGRQPKGFTRKPLYRHIAHATAALCLAGTAIQAQAMSFDLDNGVTVDWDTTLTYDAQWRMEDPNDTGLSGGGNGLLALVTDDGNRNFEKHDMTQNRISFSTDLDINYGDGGLFLRARGHYDEVYDDSSLAAQNNPTFLPPSPYTGLSADKSFQQDGIEDHRDNIELLDAFVYHNFELGERVASVRLGRQVVNWGESLFITGGISSAQGPLDATKANSPGVELKDIFLPIGQLYVETDITENLSAGAYYQWEWEETRIDAPGTFFNVLDGLGQGSVGDRGDTGLVLAQLSGDPSAALLTTPVIETEPDEGQFGIALRYLAENLNSTEFGLYYLQYNDFTPALQFDLLPAVAMAPQAVVVNHEYFEDIDLIGLSFGTVFGDTNVSGEISYRDGAPVQLAYAAGFQYERAETAQAQVSVIHLFGETPVADSLALTAEVAYNRVLDIDNGKYAQQAALINPGFDTRDVSASLDNDRGAASAVVRLAADYFNLAEGLDLKVTGTYRNDFNGVSSVMYSFTEGVEVLGLKAAFTYMNAHSFGMSYTWFLTDQEEALKDRGEIELGHLNADRDNLALYYKYTF